MKRAFIEEKCSKERQKVPTARRPPAKTRTSRLAKEDGEEDDRFGESHSDNRLNQYLSGCFWIAANRLTGFEADEANADRNRKGCCCYVNLTSDFCEDIEHNMYR
jgi:hypothetical protein